MKFDVGNEINVGLRIINERMFGDDLYVWATLPMDPTSYPSDYSRIMLANDFRYLDAIELLSEIQLTNRFCRFAFPNEYQTM